MLCFLIGGLQNLTCDAFIMQNERQNGVTAGDPGLLGRVVLRFQSHYAGDTPLRPLLSCHSLSQAWWTEEMQHKVQGEDQGIPKWGLERGSPIPRLAPQLQHNTKALLPRLSLHIMPSLCNEERDHNALSRDVRWELNTQDCMGVPDACLTDAILSALRRDRIKHYNPNPSPCHIKQCDSFCAICLLSD